MKATDLMINDWVYLSEKSRYAMQVTLIDGSNCTLDFEGNEADFFDGIYGDNGIAPIPLTTELLELNGWRDEHDSWYLHEWCDDIVLFGDDEDGFLWYIFDTATTNKIYVTTAYYVHDLQHILRIRGYDNIADNFKISK